MAQSRKKRRRKHRGTQAGNIETPSHRSSPKTGSRSGSTSSTRARRQMKPPSLRSAAIKAAAAAAVFGILSATLFHSKGGATTIAFTVIVVFAIYVPVAYSTDKAVYKRRQAKAQLGK
jgi:hypothetical protein